MEYDKDILAQTGIFVFRNALSKVLCTDLIGTFHESKKEHKQGLTGSGYRPDIKNTIDWNVAAPHLKTRLDSILQIALTQIMQVRHGLKSTNMYWSGYQFQYNKVNEGYFKWHIDADLHNPKECRLLAPIFYLNTVDEGGFTEFAYQKFNVKPEEGTLVIFPATWEYYHRGVKPLSNDKYIITTFGMCSRG